MIFKKKGALAVSAGPFFHVFAGRSEGMLREFMYLTETERL